MFVHDFDFVERPVHEVRQRLISDPKKWLESAFKYADEVGDTVLLKLGLGGGIAKWIELKIGTPRMRGEVLVLPISWEATGPKNLFPKMQAELEVASFGPDQTQLVFLGSYEAPLGGIGEKMDNALMHRVAEASIRKMISQLAISFSNA